MTVLVGVLCQDGVVVGSDSSATFAAGQFRTIEQPTQKVFVINTDMVVACTGSVGLAQRFAEVCRQLRMKEAFGNVNRFNVSQAIAANVIAQFTKTQAPMQLGALVAFRSQEGYQLCEFDSAHLQPEFKTDQTWFVSMGSGQPICDPLLGMLRRVFFDGKQPKVNEGLFAVTWAIEHAIELNPGGINGPMRIAVLSHDTDKNEVTAKMVTDDQVQEHQANVKGIEDHIAKYREVIAGQAASPDVPAQPQPPPATARTKN